MNQSTLRTAVRLARIIRYTIAAVFLSSGLLPVLLVAGTGTVQAQSAGGGSEARTYAIRFLGPDQARYMIERQLPPGSGDNVIQRRKLVGGERADA